MTEDDNEMDNELEEEDALELSVSGIDNVEEIERELAKRYVESIDDNWIQRKFKNKGFEMATEEIEGTTLFDILENLFNNENIRETFSNAITQDHVSRYTKLYNNLKNGIQGIINKQRQLAIDIKNLKGSDDETKQKRKQLRVILKNTKKKIDEKEKC